ncbi:MAG: YfiR family protein [Gammaproteobacteria bacterium]|nr:YfiR family protein [Gammaproteobacteria bacterium]
MTRRTRGSLARGLGALLLCLSLLPCATLADSTSETIAKIKAAYLLNFLRFSEWPAESFSSRNSPITLCVLGRDTLGRTLDATMQEQRVAGRLLQIVRLAGDSVDKPSSAIEQCHLVFISRSEAGRVDHITERLAGTNTLTIGEVGDFADHGAMLALNYEDDRVIFYANPAAIRAGKVHLSSKILQLARIVPVRTGTKGAYD